MKSRTDKVTAPNLNLGRWGRGGCMGVLLGALGLLGILFLLSGWHTVDSGKVGVTRSFGRITGTRAAGGFWVQPVGFSMVEYDLRVAKTIGDQRAALSNQQTLFINSAAYQYNLTPEAARRLLETVGDQQTFEDRVVTPRLQSAMKRITPQYSAAEVLAKRSEMEQNMEESLAKDLEEYRIESGSVDITLADIDFDPEYRKSIDAKAKAEQDKQVELANLDKQKTKNEQELQQARTDAEKAKLAAQGQANAEHEKARGEADATRLRASAEAAANAEIARSLTPQLISYRYAQNWNGQLPTTSIGEGGVLPTFQLPAGDANNGNQGGAEQPTGSRNP